MGAAFFSILLVGIVFVTIIQGFNVLLGFYLFVCTMLLLINIPAALRFIKTKLPGAKWVVAYASIYAAVLLMFFMFSGTLGKNKEENINNKINKAANLLANEKKEDALKILLSIPEENRETPYYYRSIAATYARSGDFDNAKKAYNSLFSLNPTSFENYYNYGLLLYEKKEYPQALEHFIKAIEINPGFWQAYFNAGLCAWQQNNMREAIYYLSLTKNRNPINPETAYYLSKAYFISDNWLIAREEINDALKLDLPDEKKAELNAMLKELPADADYNK